jgi:hypothetical protein
LVTDVTGAAGHRNQQPIDTLRHKEAIGKLQGLVLDEDIAFADAGMRGVVFVDAVRVEAEFSDSDPVRLAPGQPGGGVGRGVALSEGILAPDAAALDARRCDAGDAGCR